MFVSVKRERDVMSVLSTFVYPIQFPVFSRGGIIDRIWNKQKTTKSIVKVFSKKQRTIFFGTNKNWSP